MNTSVIYVILNEHSWGCVNLVAIIGMSCMHEAEKLQTFHVSLATFLNMFDVVLIYVKKKNTISMADS